MQFRCLTALAVLLAVAVAGCGGSSPMGNIPAKYSQGHSFGCHHRTPAQAGECIQQELRAQGVQPAAPPLATELFGAVHAGCVDISRWQGSPNWRLVRLAGVRCVIVQTNDGGAHNPLFVAQVRGAHAAGLRVGVYLFVESGSASYQVAVARSVARSVPSSYITLGAFADAEVTGAYAVTCAVVRDLHAYWRVVGVYGSPGTYRGGRCIGVIWPAEWGGGRAYPLAGYPSSAIKFRQNCGTCHLAGFGGEVDRDEDLGLLALAPHKPSRAQIKHQLDHDYRYRRHLRRVLLEQGCRVVRPSAHCRGVLKSGARVNRTIARIHSTYHIY